MVTTPPTITSPSDVLSFIPDNDLEYYSHLDEDEIRNGHACTCDHDTKFGRREDSKLYTGDKQGIMVCSDCDGYYGIVIPNWS